jgi:hypothetical protein
MGWFCENQVSFEWHCMEVELNWIGLDWIQIPKFDWNL